MSRAIRPARLFKALGAAVMLLVALGGCGGDGDSTTAAATTEDAAGSSTTEGGGTGSDGGAGGGREALDACALLPKADLERISGVSYQEGEADEGSSSVRCSYLDQNSRQLVSIDVSTERAQVQMDNTVDNVPNLEELTEVKADSAYSNSLFNVYILKGELFAQLGAQIADMTPEKRLELAQTVASNLPG